MDYHQITLNEWQQWKEEIRQKLKETAGNFVYIGYRLRQIRDSGIYDGAADIFEFAQKEYGLGKSTVSRFIAIQEKFADPDEPLLLKKEYESIGSSKLSEMLTLPDSECEMISEHSTVKDIRSLKEFNREAEKASENKQNSEIPIATSQQDEEKPKEEKPEESEIEDFMPKPSLPTDDLSWYEKCIYDFFGDPSLKEAFNIICLGDPADEAESKRAYEMINPSGARTHKKGVCFISMLDWERGVRYKLFGEAMPHVLTWAEYMKDIADMAGMLLKGEITDDVWSMIYATNAINACSEDDFEEEKKTEDEKTEKPEKPAEIKEEPVATSQQTVVEEKKTEDEKPEKADKSINAENPAYAALEKAVDDLVDAVKRKDWLVANQIIEDVRFRLNAVRELGL